MEREVREELVRLLAYAKAVGDRARREPADADHHEWWSRLMGGLPPTDWIDVESDDAV